MRASSSSTDKARLFPSAVSLIGLLMIAVTSLHASGAMATATQKAFASPGEAVKSLVGALEKNDATEMSAIFGPGSETVISSGDDVLDKANRARFLKHYAEKNTLERMGDDLVVLQVGNDDWPFPIPIVREGSGWRFDTDAGKEEIVNRRIGTNELHVIDVLHAYVAAQREYAARDREVDGAYAFAQKIGSSPGKKDGLYWKAAEGEEASPLGPLAAEAAREGYAKKRGSDAPVPLYGYYYRILKAQGEHASGGRYDYVVKGNMILGFAMVAYPAGYGSSGIMTFIVNQEGIVYQKDLGKDTTKTAEAMKRYDPDPTWKKVEAGTQDSPPEK